MNVDATEIKLSLRVDEFNFIFTYHLADKEQFKKLVRVKGELLRKRLGFKRVNLMLTLEDLDALLVNISRAGNEGNCSKQDQYMLDVLFGKLAHKYNTNVHRCMKC